MIRVFFCSLLLLFFAPLRAQEGERELATRAVIAYLEGIVGEESVELLLEETVLSPFLSHSRREGVVTRVENLREQWKTREIVFESIDSTFEKEYGVVVVELRDEDDPLAVEVIGLGVQRKKGEWRPVPLPGSFEAVFLGFDEEVEELVGRMERWMALESGRLNAERLTNARSEFQKKLSQASEGFLGEDDPSVVVKHFLEVCRQRELMAALACLREMEEGQDYEWMEMKDILSIGLQGKDARDQWRLLTDPYVFNSVGEVDIREEESSVQVIFYDLNKSQGVCDLRFDLFRSGNRWGIVLPPELRFADYEEGRFRGLTRMGRENEGLELFDDFLLKFNEKHEQQVFSSLQKASEEIIKRLQADNMTDLLSVLSRDETISLKEKSMQFRSAAEFWVRFRESDDSWEFRAVAQEEKEHAGILVFARIDPEKLDWVHLEPLYMIRKMGEWTIAPGVDEPGNFDAGEEAWRKEEKELRKLFRTQDEFYLHSLLPSFSEIVSQVDVDSVRWGKAEAESAGILVRKFRGLLDDNKMMEALKLSAVVEPGEAVWEGMRSLTYTARGIQQAPEPDVYHSEVAAGPWSRVSVQVAAPADGEPQFLMYLVGPTKNGPRVVIDADLRLATNKGRELLNENKLRRLGEILGEENLRDATTLFQQHNEETQKIYEEWQKNNTSSP